MTVNVHVLNGLSRLSEDVISAAKGGVRDAVDAYSPHAIVENIDVSIQPHEGVVYGRAFGPESFTLYLNPDDPVLAEWQTSHFKHLCIHELHHVLRWRHLSLRAFSDWTPGEVLALEGLATQCEMFLGCPSYPLIETTAENVNPLLKRLAPDIGAKYADVHWFDDGCDLPGGVTRAAGPMGHVLVGRFLERAGETPISAIDASWQTIWDVGHQV